jgi:hypothetical protein
LLRSSRVALLFGEAGTDKTTLLKLGLMPLLGRRTTDQAGARASCDPVAVALPERRSHGALRSSLLRRELVVYFDDWIDHPLDALNIRLHLAAATGSADGTASRQRLGDTLAGLSSRLDTNIVVLLDRFEELLALPAQREDIAEFLDQLVEAIGQRGLPANFLISLEERARPRLSGLSARIPGFDDFSLRLTRPQRRMSPVRAVLADADVIELPASGEPVLSPDTSAGLAAADPVAAGAAAMPQAPPKPRTRVRPPPPAPIKAEDVYALIEARLAHTASETTGDPFLPPKPDLRSKGARGYRGPVATGDAADAQDTVPLISRAVEWPDEGTPVSVTEAAPAADGSAPLAPTRGRKIDAAIEWVRRLRAKGKSKA